MRDWRTQNNRGQFVPIAAMVIFTIVIFILAVINVYRVAKVKLQLQNIADAIALNLAAREASSLNFIADRNKWLNKLYADERLNTDPSTNGGTCPSSLNHNTTTLPGLSCVDQDTSQYVFHSDTGAKAYARLVKSVNDSQRLAVDAYDTFLGAGSSVGSSQRALQDILQNDIPVLKTDKSIRIITWNSAQNQIAADTELGNARTSPESYFNSSRPPVSANMQRMKGALAVHDVKVRIETHGLFGAKSVVANQAFSTLLGTSDGVGWMGISQQQSVLPTLSLPNHQQRIGAGAIVLKPVSVLGVVFPVSARAVAYVVAGSGDLPVSDWSSSNGPPTFSPTYWVKLVNSPAR